MSDGCRAGKPPVWFNGGVGQTTEEAEMANNEDTKATLRRAGRRFAYLLDIHSRYELDKAASDDERTWGFIVDHLQDEAEFEAVMESIVSWADFDVADDQGRPTEELLLLAGRMVLNEVWELGTSQPTDEMYREEVAYAISPEADADWLATKDVPLAELRRLAYGG